MNRLRLPSWLFPSLSGYNRAWLTGDIVAGLTVWSILVPEALAYATIAGVSPIVGLYAALPALVLYAAFGSSRHLVVGPMSATAALSAATVAEYAATGEEIFLSLTIAVALIAGVAGLIAAVCRLGFLAHFISEPVLKGFIIGLALEIIAGQISSLMGMEKGGGNFFEKLWHVLSHLEQINGWAMAIGLISLGTVLALHRTLPRVPSSLVAVVIGSLAVVLFNAEEHGVAIVGDIDSGLPSFGLPSGVSGSQYLDLVPGALGILLVGFAEGLGAAKNYASRHGYEIDADRELLGLGAANLGSGLAGGFIVNGSLSKTAVNDATGAKSQLSGLLVAALTLLTLLFLTGLFEKLPEATLAAIVIAVLVDLIDIPALVRLYHLRSRRLKALGPAARADFLAAAAALAGVLVFDILPGLFIGIAASMILLLYRAYRPRVAVLGRIPGSRQYGDIASHPENDVFPGIVVIRAESGLFFANAERVRHEIQQLAAEPGVETVVLDASTTPFVDVTAALMLLELNEILKKDGKSLVVAQSIGQVRDILALVDDHYTLNIVPSVDDGVRSVRRDTGGG